VDGPIVDLPLTRAEWPGGWQEAWEERAAILEMDHGQSRPEAERLAEEVIRNEYRRRYGPRAALAERLAAELGLDLQALSATLGTDLRTLEQAEASEWQMRLLFQSDEVCRSLLPDEQVTFDIFLCRYIHGS
jgi:hypothetical protein